MKTGAAWGSDEVRTIWYRDSIRTLGPTLRVPLASTSFLNNSNNGEYVWTTQNRVNNFKELTSSTPQHNHAVYVIIGTINTGAGRGLRLGSVALSAEGARACQAGPRREPTQADTRAHIFPPHLGRESRDSGTCQTWALIPARRTPAVGLLSVLLTFSGLPFLCRKPRGGGCTPPPFIRSLQGVKEAACENRWARCLAHPDRHARRGTFRAPKAPEHGVGAHPLCGPFWTLLILLAVRGKLRTGLGMDRSGFWSCLCGLQSGSP